jgi:haloalkane dehalogenase
MPRDEERPGARQCGPRWLRDPGLSDETTSRLWSLPGLEGMVSSPRPPEVPESRALLGLHLNRLVIPSGDISYIDEGEGPPVVLVHGGPVTSLGFVRVIRKLRETHRVIAPDLPGFGQSRAASTFTASLSAYAQSVREFCIALGVDRLVLFGYDAGACIALAAASAMPERIAGLIVADAVPFPLVGRARLVKWVLTYLVASRLVRFLNRRFNLFPWLVATLDPLRRPFPAEERAALVGQYDSPEKRERIIDLFESMGRDDSFMQQTASAVAETLAEKPTLLLFGQFDPMRFFGGVSRFRKLLPSSSVAIILGEKHFPILAAGEDVARAISEWFGRIGRGKAPNEIDSSRATSRSDVLSGHEVI